MKANREAKKPARRCSSWARRTLPGSRARAPTRECASATVHAPGSIRDRPASQHVATAPQTTRSPGRSSGRATRRARTRRSRESDPRRGKAQRTLNKCAGTPLRERGCSNRLAHRSTIRRVHGGKARSSVLSMRGGEFAQRPGSASRCALFHDAAERSPCLAVRQRTQLLQQTKGKRLERDVREAQSAPALARPLAAWGMIPERGDTEIEYRINAGNWVGRPRATPRAAQGFSARPEPPLKPTADEKADVALRAHAVVNAVECQNHGISRGNGAKAPYPIGALRPEVVIVRTPDRCSPARPEHILLQSGPPNLRAPPGPAPLLWKCRWTPGLPPTRGLRVARGWRPTCSRARLGLRAPPADPVVPPP